MEFLLKENHPVIQIIHTILVFRELVGIDNPVELVEFSRNIQLEINIYAMLLEFGDEIVELFKLYRLNERVQHRILFRSPMADIVHPDYIDAISGELLDQFISLFMRRETACHTALGTHKADYIAIPIHKMITFCGYESALPGRTAVNSCPSAHIGNIIRCIMSRLEREHRCKISRLFNLVKNIRTCRLSINITGNRTHGKSHKKQQFLHNRN